jgi:hypothetical protein
MLLLNVLLNLLLELQVDLLYLNRVLLDLFPFNGLGSGSVLAGLLQVMLRYHLLQLHVHVLYLLRVLHLDVA